MKSIITGDQKVLSKNPIMYALHLTKVLSAQSAAMDLKGKEEGQHPRDLARKKRIRIVDSGCNSRASI